MLIHQAGERQNKQKLTHEEWMSFFQNVLPVQERANEHFQQIGSSSTSPIALNETGRHRVVPNSSSIEDWILHDKDFKEVWSHIQIPNRFSLMEWAGQACNVVGGIIMKYPAYRSWIIMGVILSVLFLLLMGLGAFLYYVMIWPLRGLSGHSSVPNNEAVRQVS